MEPKLIRSLLILALIQKLFSVFQLPDAAAFVFCLKFVDLSLSKLFCTMGRLAASFLLVSGVLRAEGGSKMSESSLL